MVPLLMCSEVQVQVGAMYMKFMGGKGTQSQEAACAQVSRGWKMGKAHHVGEHLLFLARKCLCCKLRDAGLECACCGSVPTLGMTGCLLLQRLPCALY